jgi:hypothetical protein
MPSWLHDDDAPQDKTHLSLLTPPHRDQTPDRSTQDSSQSAATMLCAPHTTRARSTFPVTPPRPEHRTLGARNQPAPAAQLAAQHCTAPASPAAQATRQSTRGPAQQQQPTPSLSTQPPLAKLPACILVHKRALITSAPPLTCSALVPFFRRETVMLRQTLRYMPLHLSSLSHMRAP